MHLPHLSHLPHPYCSLSHLNSGTHPSNSIVYARKLGVILDFVPFSLFLLLPYPIHQHKLLTLPSNFLSLLAILTATTLTTPQYLVWVTAVVSLLVFPYLFSTEWPDWHRNINLRILLFWWNILMASHCPLNKIEIPRCGLSGGR